MPAPQHPTVREERRAVPPPVSSAPCSTPCARQPEYWLLPILQAGESAYDKPEMLLVQNHSIPGIRAKANTDAGTLTRAAKAHLVGQQIWQA